ncbi:uncharacterized protein LOC130500152 [Raphanus sativus]|uniref:Uncharacterized protein LOC130500152 n=1 Tax=Raphanus sativus TaxID=3726 RepID=A0A9W3CH12_RAPSA|nr:uncharacterized protein LOC130500152 [Raphanus sativus]
MDPPEVLRIAKGEATVWAEAQLTIPTQISTNTSSLEWMSMDSLRICFIDGAWRAKDKFSGQRWFYKKNRSTEKLMRAMNLRRSLSALHAECEALIWAMECMKTLNFSDVVFATDCFQLVKMVSSPGEWPAFATHLEEF